MPITINNKPQLTGIIILFIGVTLLAFTFINAFLFLQEPFSIIATGDLAKVFGDALAPLIQASIRLMYLGIMGWIGSLLTVRGIPLVTHKYVPVAAPMAIKEKPQHQPKGQPVRQPKPQPRPSKPEPKPTPQQLTQQQPKPTSQYQTQATQEQPPQVSSEPKQEEPKAVLIPPENQREE